MPLLDIEGHTYTGDTRPTWQVRITPENVIAAMQLVCKRIDAGDLEPADAWDFAEHTLASVDGVVWADGADNCDRVLRAWYFGPSLRLLWRSEGDTLALQRLHIDGPAETLDAPQDVLRDFFEYCANT